MHTEYPPRDLLRDCRHKKEGIFPDFEGWRVGVKNSTGRYGALKVYLERQSRAKVKLKYYTTDPVSSKEFCP